MSSLPPEDDDRTVIRPKPKSPTEATPEPATKAAVDNGPALPQEALRIILDPFRITSGAPSEYGINLMACFFIAHHHGGKIEARNLPGAGNVISVRLPLQPPNSKDANAGTDFFRKAVLNDGLWGKLSPGK